VSDRVVGAFRQFFRDFVPELASAAIDRTRVCFYCDAPGGRFLIDRVPGRGSLIVAAGGSGHGFKFAPVIGDLIAAVALDEEHPRRAFTAWRDPGRKGDAARAGGIGDLPR
jgi:glycine/D-amino acid oxidase-like deaminating enzyme